MTVKHAQVDVQVDQIIRDGDMDANLTKAFIALPETDYVIWHKLDRVPRQVQIVWKDEFCDFKVAKDLQGRPMQDREKIVLNFFAANVTLLLRLA